MNNGFLVYFGFAFFLIVILLLFVMSPNNQDIIDTLEKEGFLNRDITSGILDVNFVNPLEPDGSVPVSVQDYNGELFSFFLTKELQLTTLADDAALNSFSLNLTDGTGCLVGDAIDLWDDEDYFQGIITSVAGDTISFVPSIINEFSSSNTIVKCGEWNLNLDGSVNKQTFYVSAPTNRSWDIESAAIQFKDNSDWDISMFGSRTALTNGFTGGISNSDTTRYFLIYNNGGFALRGFELTNIEKAPSGSYGFTANIDFDKRHGAVPALHGSHNDSFIINVNDDLTSQEEIAFVIRGHYKNDFD